MLPKVKALSEESSEKLVYSLINIDECSKVSCRDMPRDGGKLPFIKVYANGKIVGTAKEIDEKK